MAIIPYSLLKKTVDIPIIGKVTAGQPILAIEHIEDTFPIPIELAQRGSLFMLRVQGDSMVEAGIYNDDYVLVKQQNNAINGGDIVVALIEDEATIKRFFLKRKVVFVYNQKINQCLLYLLKMCLF